MRFSLKSGFMWLVAAGFFLATGCREARERAQPYAGSPSLPGRIGWLRERIGATAVNNRFDSCLCYAQQMLRCAEQGGGTPADEVFACCYVGQSAFFLGRYDTASRYLERALEQALRANDVWGIGAAYNGLGQLAVCARMDYLRALGCFTESVRVLEGSPYRSLYYVAMSNLALTYWHRNDPAGLPYALRVLEYGREQRDPMHVFYGTYACAAMYYLLGDSGKALGYIRETGGLVDRFYDKTGVYTLSANILHAAGQEQAAAAHFRIAFSHLDEAEATSAVDYYLGYGRFLIDAARYREAASVLREGIAVAGRSGNTVSRYLLFRNLSLVYRRMGAYRDALDCFEVYHTESDSIFSVERERSMSEMQVRYETEKKENELRQKQYEVLKERRKVQISGLLAAAIAAVLLVVWVLYRRKNALYLRIVSQYQEAIRREKALAGAVSDPDGTPAGKYALSSLTDAKSRALFAELERLMRSERIYRQQDLTKERLAEIAGCNRTYLSQVVNAQTGMNMVSYINSFRIQEAVELLSDAGSEIPLKAVALEAGFSSLSTFYKLFKQTVGMTPLKFREKVAELARSRARNTL